MRLLVKPCLSGPGLYCKQHCLTNTTVVMVPINNYLHHTKGNIINPKVAITKCQPKTFREPVMLFNAPAPELVTIHP